MGDLHLIHCEGISEKKVRILDEWKGLFVSFRIFIEVDGSACYLSIIPFGRIGVVVPFKDLEALQDEINGLRNGNGCGEGKDVLPH